MGLLRASRNVPENPATYPNAMTKPGRASGSIVMESIKFLPGKTLRVRRYATVTPISTSASVLRELRKKLFRILSRVKSCVKTLP